MHEEVPNNSSFFLSIPYREDNKLNSGDMIMELAEVALKNNIFNFDEKFFKLICGTSTEQCLHFHKLF